MTSPHDTSHQGDEAVSPRSKSSKPSITNNEPLVPQPPRSLRESLEAMDMRTDPDAQATVTDFLDFTEHLSSDMIRSLTLIGQLDDTYMDSSEAVNKLTRKWTQLPELLGEDKPTPDKLRDEISKHLRLAMRSRIHSHAEAVRMSENVKRHYNRASTLLSKLRTMLDNYPSPEELEKSPVLTTKSVLVSKKTSKTDSSKQKKMRVPKIIIPGEVLAPYELDDDSMSDDSEASSSEEEPEPPVHKTITLPPTRLKTGARLGRPPKVTALLATTTPAIAAAAAAAIGMVKPPPANAPPGSADAPWLRLTPFELAKLRKRMKKNATWSPSETMIARELNNLGRGPEAYKAAKQKALEEGREFEEVIPPSQPDPGSSAHIPEGALTAEALADASLSASNKGMKLNEAKKLKREAMAKMAAEEAEASERKFEEIAKMLLQTTPAQDTGKAAKAAPRSATKRKRVAGDDEAGEGSDIGTEATVNSVAGITAEAGVTNAATAAPNSATPAVLATPGSAVAGGGRATTKRIKVETPIPPPKISINTSESKPAGAATQVSQVQAQSQSLPHSTTPVPLPAHVTAQVGVETSHGLTKSASPSRTGTPVSGRKSSVEPVPHVRKSTTPILPPTRDTPRRETRGESAKKQHGATSPITPTTSIEGVTLLETVAARRSSSRTTTPRSTPGPESGPSAAGVFRRPGSRGNPNADPSLAIPTNERSRRSSGTRATPQPGDITTPQPGTMDTGTVTTTQRAKRPANTTSSGDNSAVGKRKAATRKKVRAPRKDKSAANATPTTPTGTGPEMEVDEFDEDGTPIDPNEPKYCVCNRVSFGTMIACENDECKFQWFHLGCVDLKEIPRRTTKWYCPDCRKRLNIGEKGEVTSRGIRT